MNPKVLIAGERKGEAQALAKKLDFGEAQIKVLSFGHLASRLVMESPDCLLLLAGESKRLDRALIESIKIYDDNLPLIVLSASKRVEEVVRLMKTGIYDYFSLSTAIPKLRLAIGHACRMYHLTKRVFLLENQISTEIKLDHLLGVSPSMQTIFQTIKNVAKTNATVLVTGESGTGKELVAKALHHLSKRSARRFIDINCGAIPRELLENELFGHEKGAYTGADRRYIGCCERADGGSLFLDEISEMEASLQVKLLRFLQERRFFRVGGTEPIQVDVGIIAATNKDLTKAVAQGKFREDLFYRLNVVLIFIPPLRERREDIPLLARHFLEKYAHKNEKLFLGFTEEAMEAFLNYDWPGNIRELENTIERAVVLHNDTQIKVSHLPPPFHKFQKPPATLTPAGELERWVPKKVLPLEVVERYAIEQALKVCTGDISQAAKCLQIGQATLYRKIKQFGLRVE